MEVWPAIDLRGGCCVRLKKGDYQRETVFGEDPAAMARHWAGLGGRQLHLVDLDGAKKGRPVNLESVRAIVEAVDVPCELGGGIRDEKTIGELLEAGLTRLVIGTLAIREPDWFRRMCRQFPGKLVLGIDARQGRVATDGWLQVSDMAAFQAMLESDEVKAAKAADGVIDRGMKVFAKVFEVRTPLSARLHGFPETCYA